MYWWNGYGWWWWWIAFLVIFFLLPLGWGWGYRGWGPWYRRPRRPGELPRTDASRPIEPTPRGDADVDTGWGWIAIFMWIILLIAVAWFIAAWSWGY